MNRYFLEVFYKGTGFSGFQKQHNANSVQEEIEKAFSIFQRENIMLTGASRTDAGVHALQNYFHFDYAGTIHPQFIYKMNAILPAGIAVRNLTEVDPGCHCRFDATSREYKYYVHKSKNPFLQDRAYFFPYTLDFEKLQAAEKIFPEYNDFSSFSKRNTQVKTFICKIEKSEWSEEGDTLVYHVKANRFLRGMVRGMTGTMLQVGRGKISLDQLREIILAKDCSKADFSVPSHGLFLVKVEYPEAIFSAGS